MAIKDDASGLFKEWEQEQRKAEQELREQNKQSEENIRKEFENYAEKIIQSQGEAKKKIKNSTKKQPPLDLGKIESKIELNSEDVIDSTKQQMVELKEDITKAVKKQTVKTKVQVEAESEVTYKPKYNLFTNPDKEYTKIKKELGKYYDILGDDGTEKDEKRFVGYFARAKEEGLTLKEEYTEMFDMMVKQSSGLKKLAQEVSEEYRKRLEMVIEMEQKAETITSAPVTPSQPKSKNKSSVLPVNQTEVLSGSTLPVLQQEESKVEDINEDLEKQSDLYKQIYERVEKIRMLGTVGANKNDESDIVESYGKESRNAEAFKMQMDAIKTLSPTGEMNPDIRDMVLNSELSLEEVTKKLVEAAEEYVTCKKALDDMFAKAGIAGGKVYDDAYRNLSMYSLDSEGMFGVIGETREKLAIIKSENTVREEAKKKKEAEAQAQAELNKEKIEEARIQAELTRQKISGEVNQTPLSSSDIVEENNREIASNEEVIASEEKKHKYKTVARTEIPKLAKQESSAVVNANEEVINSNEEVIRSEEKVKKYTLANRNNTPKLKTEPTKDTLDVITESAEMEKVETATEQAVQAKKDFATANEGVQDSVDGSKSKLQLEAELMESIAKNARDAAKAKKDFVKANQEVKASADSSSDSLDKESKSMDKVEEATTKNNKKAFEIEKMNADAKTTPISNRIASLARTDKIGTAEYEKLMNTIKSIITLQEDYTKEVGASKESTTRLQEASDSFKDSFFKDLSTNKGALYTTFNTAINNITDSKNFSKDGLGIVNTLRDNLKALGDFKLNSIDDVEKIVSLINQISVGIKDVKAIPKEDLLPDASELNKDLGNINKVLAGGYKMSGQLRQSYRALQKAYEDAFDSNGNVKITNKELQKMRDILSKVNAEFDATGRKKSLFGSFGQRLTDMNTKFLAQYFSFQDIIRYLRQGYQYVAEIDKQMIELEKVSDMTGERLEQSFKHAAAAAKDLGATISDVVSATADWSRLGYDADAAEQLAEIAILYKNVGDGIDIDSANESLISTLQGFQLDASEAESVIDKFNEVANNYAIDSAGIGEALKRSAASFNAAHTDLSKSIALITATDEVLQNSESTGTLWKTMSARIRGASTELEELGQETDEYTESTSKLRDLIKGMTGFDIMEDEDTFKDIYDIVLGIGQEWDKLTDIERASLGEALAGKRNANGFFAVMGNLDTLQEAYETAENSAGSAMREQEKWEEGLEAKTNKLKASLEELSTTVLDSEFLGGAIDAARGFIELLTKIIDKCEILIPLLIGGGGIFAAYKQIKGEGKWGLKSSSFHKYALGSIAPYGYIRFLYYPL